MKKSLALLSLICAGAMSIPAGAAYAGSWDDDALNATRNSNAEEFCTDALTMRIGPKAISLPTSGATITKTELVPATDTVGEYCQIEGSIHPVDPNAPDIRFQATLPTDWNGRALQFGGGYNGSIPNTLGKPTLGLDDAPTPLAQGYLTFADDSGHQASSGDASFALNDEALLNYGLHAHEEDP